MKKLLVIVLMFVSLTVKAQHRQFFIYSNGKPIHLELKGTAASLAKALGNELKKDDYGFDVIWIDSNHFLRVFSTPKTKTLFHIDELFLLKGDSKDASGEFSNKFLLLTYYYGNHRKLSLDWKENPPDGMWMDYIRQGKCAWLASWVDESGWTNLQFEKGGILKTTFVDKKGFELYEQESK
jgi:hypothetical protein